MSKRLIPLVSLPVLVLVLVSACTIVRVDSEGDPPRIQSKGLIDGHVAAGIRSEDHLFHLDLFDGSSPGALGEIVIWKLFRFEIGLAGASVGLGPFDLGLGLFFYSPEVPDMEPSAARERKREHEHELETEAAPSEAGMGGEDNDEP